MFFPERIKSIGENDKVLEIGPGVLPHPRSDVFLDKIFEGKEAVAQNGHQKGIKLDKPIFYYKGTKFPFKDKEFDYVICSHVVEHVPAKELATFIKEIQRVAKKGYIEFPNIFYELINYQDVHIWLMNERKGEMLFLDKNIFKSNFVHKAFREMFYGSDNYSFELFKRHKEFFFSGFEWKGTLKYRVVKDYDALVNETDFKRVKTYFKNYQPKQKKTNLLKKILRINENN